MLNVFKNKLSQIHKQSKEAKELLLRLAPLAAAKKFRLYFALHKLHRHLYLGGWS